MSKPLQQDGASPNSRILFLVNPAHSQPCQNPSTNPVGAGGAGQKEAWGARGNLLVSFWMLLEQPGVQALLVKTLWLSKLSPDIFLPILALPLPGQLSTLPNFGGPGAEAVLAAAGPCALPGLWGARAHELGKGAVQSR